MDFGTILSLLFALAAIALILYLSFVLSKFLAGKINNVSNSNNIKIIERVSLTQDKGLAVVEIGHKYYLVGFSTNNIEILQELEEADLHFPSPTAKPKFIEILNNQIKSRMDMRSSGKDKQKAASSGEQDDGKEDKEEK